jgi:hypothetical protein
MRLETDPDVSAKPSLLPKVWRWLWQPVDFWRAMEVLGLWTAAAVGVAAIHSANEDSRQQVSAMRDQLRTMSGQLDEMQEESRAWIGPASLSLVAKDRDEPLRVNIGYRNFGRQPATFVRASSTGSFVAMDPGKRIEDLAGWKVPAVFDPKSQCKRTSSYTTEYPGDIFLSFEGGVSKANQLSDDQGHQVSFQTLLDGVAQKHELYVVYGCFTYVAGQKHEFTTFCAMLDPTSSNNMDLSTWKLAFCPFGNDNGEDKAAKE